MHLKEISESLSLCLALRNPPVGLTFVKEPPKGVQEWKVEVPSACRLWREAETRVFYADQDRHFNCPVGGMVMGFDLPARVKGELQSVVEKMTGCNYLQAEETGHLPSVPGQKSGIVYGPLSQFPLLPDLVLLWLTPRQVMILEEGIGGTRWTPNGGMQIFGRPSCAALPVALSEKKSTVSLGCIGMRTFTEIEDDRLLVALPGSQLDDSFIDGVKQSVEANRQMLDFYQEHQNSFSKLFAP